MKTIDLSTKVVINNADEFQTPSVMSSVSLTARVNFLSLLSPYEKIFDTIYYCSFPRKLDVCNAARGRVVKIVGYVLFHKKLKEDERFLLACVVHTGYMTELMCYRKNRLIPIIEALADIMKGHYSKVNFSYSMRVFDRITMNTTAEGDPRITIFLEAVKEERDQYATAFDRFLMKLDGMTYQTEQQNDGEQEPNS